MPDTSHRLVLAASAMPYLALALYDGWLHGCARRVPWREQAVHGVVAISLAGLGLGLFHGRPRLALTCLAVFAVAALTDELAWHGSLASRERRVHHLAYACFAGFIALAWWLGALRWS
jgi:hypothetical protein